MIGSLLDGSLVILLLAVGDAAFQVVGAGQEVEGMGDYWKAQSSPMWGMLALPRQ